MSEPMMGWAVTLHAGTEPEPAVLCYRQVFTTQQLAEEHLKSLEGLIAELKGLTMTHREDYSESQVLPMRVRPAVTPCVSFANRAADGPVPAPALWWKGRAEVVRDADVVKVYGRQTLYCAPDDIQGTSHTGFGPAEGPPQVTLTHRSVPTHSRSVHSVDELRASLQVTCDRVWLQVVGPGRETVDARVSQEIDALAQMWGITSITGFASRLEEQATGNAVWRLTQL